MMGGREYITSPKGDISEEIALGPIRPKETLRSYWTNSSSGGSGDKHLIPGGFGEEHIF